MQVVLSDQEIRIILACLYNTSVTGKSAERFAEIISKLRDCIDTSGDQTNTADMEDLSDHQ